MEYPDKGLLRHLCSVIVLTWDRFVLLRVLAVIVLVWVGLTLGAIVGMICLMAYNYWQLHSIGAAADASIALNSGSIALMSIIGYTLVILFFVIFMTRAGRRKITLDDIGLGLRKNLIKNFCAGMLIIIAWFILSLIATDLILGSGFAGAQSVDLVISFSQSPLSLLLLSATILCVSQIVIGFVEEVIFRGYVQKALVHRYGIAIGLIGASLIFMLAHGSLNFTLFLVGLILGFLYLMTRSLWMSIGCHFVFNFTLSETTSGQPLSSSYPAFTLASAPGVPYFNNVVVLAQFSVLLLIVACLWLYYIRRWKPRNMPDVATEQQIYAGNPRYAGFTLRFMAYIIDLLILTGIYILMTIFVIPGNSLPAMFLGTLTMIAIEVTYYTVFTASKLQATPGKVILGIIVVGESGQRLTTWKALWRAVLKVLSEFMLLLGIGLIAFAFVAFTRKKQAVYDLMIHTYVVKGKAMDVCGKEEAPLVRSSEQL